MPSKRSEEQPGTDLCVTELTGTKLHPLPSGQAAEQPGLEIAPCKWAEKGMLATECRYMNACGIVPECRQARDIKMDPKQRPTGQQQQENQGRQEESALQHKGQIGGQKTTTFSFVSATFFSILTIQHPTFMVRHRLHVRNAPLQTLGT